VGFSYIGYITAATWTNMDAEEWLEKGRGRLGRQPTDAAMMNAKRMEEAKKAQDTLKTLPSVLSFLPNFILVPILRTYIMVAEHRINSPNATRTQAELIAIFGTVFICWKLRSLQPFMTRWFVHNPIAWTKRQDWRNSFTMLTSTVSQLQPTLC
jgi:rhomboid-like protein